MSNTTMGGVIQSTPVTMLFDKLEKQEVTGNIQGNYSSTTGKTDVTVFGGRADVTIKDGGTAPSDGNAAVNFSGGSQLNITNGNSLQQIIEGIGRFDYVFHRFSTSCADLYLAAAGIVTGSNNKQQDILGRIDTGGGLRLDARIKTESGYLRFDTSVFALDEENSFYDLPARNTFIVSFRELAELVSGKIKITLDGLAYLDTLMVGASRFTASGSVGYAADKKVEVGFAYKVDINLNPPKSDINEIFQTRTMYIKVGF